MKAALLSQPEACDTVNHSRRSLCCPARAAFFCRLGKRYFNARLRPNASNERHAVHNALTQNRPGFRRLADRRPPHLGPKGGYQYRHSIRPTDTPTKTPPRRLKDEHPEISCANEFG